MEKNYRVHTNMGDTLLNVNMQQDFDFLEVLSLKLGKKDTYRLHSSNYGVIAGRVLANDAFGVPNAKLSVFIKRESSDSNELANIYPYVDVMSKDNESRRYNLLPDYSDDSCYKVVGTFPRKRYVLDDNIQVEVYEKYWKYTTVTNQSGDYMLFGVPTGGQQIHVDIDLSDIGILSQKPSDFIFKGHTVEEFDSPSQFKSSTNLETLQQIISQNQSTVVYPFWGDDDNGTAAITRCDIQVNYKFEPTCVFMGSIVSDNDGNSIGHKCAPSVDSGLNTQLIAGEGTIEMIRKTQDGLVESFSIKGNALIDSDGVWCYQIPMNLDYIGTDEYGNIVPTDNPNVGIPTRTQVRFRISKRETGEEGFSRHTAKYLVPMNPIFSENSVEPMSLDSNGQDIERMYNFGSNTPQSCFRDLYWNNVYSVKNFIPKTQVAHRAYANNFSALKGGNLAEDQNPLPFNKLRIDIPFMYMVLCIIYQLIITVVTVINFIISTIDIILGLFSKIKNIPVGPWKPFKYVFGFIPDPIGCIYLPGGLSEDNKGYYPGCWNSEALDESDCPDGADRCDKSHSGGDLLDKIQQNLANDYKIVKMDFYQDWVNGVLYMPLWYWRKRKKKTFLFITIARAKSEFCDCDKTYSRLKTYVTCNMQYTDNSMTYEDSDRDENNGEWHRKKKQWVRYRNGLIKGVENKDGLTAYYYVAYQADNRDLSSVPMSSRNRPFKIVRLYATDIILLGNLNENNIYGIPQLFKALPSTTANIPPIAAIEESTAPETLNDNGSSNDVVGDSIDSGTTITTGVDWGRHGGDDTPKLKKGLFINLRCVAAGTEPKSCINIERLSEFGVNPDMTFSMSYSNGSTNIKTGVIDSDGFISKYELDDMDNRAVFATLNHIGFIPQDYQNSVGSYTTQVVDENTGYLVPKFRYIYPVDFDGRLSNIMKRYKGNFEQAMYDETDESYLTFRLGAENEDSSDGRIRHFYHKNGNTYEMPLYNNSFYFYFGINKGNTAIDKFNRLFYSPCFKNEVSPFSINTTSMGRSFCPETYVNVTTGYNGYAYIRFTSDDITVPFKYTLYSSSSNIIIEESDMTATDFVIGGTLNENGEIVMNENGIVKYQLKDEAVDNNYGISGMTNQVYTLEVIDNNGRKLSERVELKVPTVSIDFESEGLSTKFYSTGATRMDYICTDNTGFYGKIKIKSFTIDGFMCYITGATPLSYDSTNDTYKIKLDGKMCEFDSSIDPSTGSEVIVPKQGTERNTSAIVRIGAMGSPNVGWVRDCMCDTGNTVWSVNGQNSFIAKATTYKYWFSFDRYQDGDNDKMLDGQGEAVLYVYQPNRFTLAISQLCGNRELTDNATSEIVTVSNGNNFNAFLNDMPVKFMLGTNSDSSDATVANTSKFYKSDAVTDELDSHISGWYGLHQEDSYMFSMSENQVLLRNQDMWTDFVQIQDNINNHDVKANILRFKFLSMFSLCKAAYVVSDGNRFYYDTVGGVSPILYRSVIPSYSNDKKITAGIYVLTDDSSAYCPYYLPNIVGSNYKGQDDNDGPQFNKVYKYPKYVGNYFAAFTRNGGYTSRTEVDSNIKVMSLPNFTKVTPWNVGGNKKLGKDDEGRIDTRYKPAHTATDEYQPYLRAMFVDRRLDFDFVIFAPCFNVTTRLYPSDDPGKENIWKSARISGITYNGVEMSYDEDYNIISADVNDDGSAIPNKRLEYSYSYSDADEDAKTYYNSESNMVWESDESNGQIIKRFYEASFVGTDIRNYFWSSFNKERLHQYAEPLDINTSTNYVYKYPYNVGGYNGDFNRNNVIMNKNYPTKRLIDVGNIEPKSSYDLTIDPCSYSIRPYNEDGVITCEAEAEPGISITTSFSSPISFIAPNQESKIYENALYRRNESENGYARFITKVISLMFNINAAPSDDYNVYTSYPKLIKVLPYPNGSNYDGISSIKTITPNGEVAYGGSLNSILDSDNVVLYSFKRLSSNWMVRWADIADTLVPDGVKMGDMRLMDGSKAHGQYYYKNTGGEDVFLTSDSTEFQSISYYLTNQPIKNLSIFTIMVERTYVSQDEDGLKKSLRSIEFGDLYDVRKILIKVNTGETYIEKVEIGAGNVDNTEGNPDDEEMSINYAHVQTITFDLYLPKVDNPLNSVCESFADYTTMSYKFRFTNKSDQAYEVGSSNIEAVVNEESEDVVIKIQVRWTQEMGVMADTIWAGATKCSIIAKTKSNFTYRLDDFNFNWSSNSQPEYNQKNKSSDLNPGEIALTKIQITGL